MLNFFKKGKKQPKSLKEILNYLKDLEKKIEVNSEGLASLEKEGKFNIQKTGMVRFNPFSGVGGDQSFSVALLDGNNDGVVITSIYARDGNRVYAKPIKSSKSEYSLSNEEKEAIERAVVSK
jgi:hypothetical protein